MKKSFSLIFIILLIAPVALWLAGHMRGNGDNTVRQGFPQPEAALWLDREYYQAVEGWFQESLPVANHLKILNNWLNYHLFAATSTPAVNIGIHGWLYPGNIGAARLTPKVARNKGYRLFLDLHAVEKIISAAGRRFLFTVVPGKEAIYPEYLGSGGTATQITSYQALLDANRLHPLAGFIELEPALKKAKLGGIDVYRKRSLQWSCEGAAAAAEAILSDKALTQTASVSHVPANCPPPDNDLYRTLLGEAVPPKAPLTGHTSGPHAVEGPSVVVYGDDYLTYLLPFITHAFNGIEIFDSSREPTFGHNIMAADSDMIVLESSATGIERLHLDLESLYAAAGPQQMQGVVKREISLEEATAISQCALGRCVS